MRLDNSYPTSAALTWLIGALLLSGFGLIAALILSSAISDHTKTMRTIANRSVVEQTADMYVSDENWKQIIEQVAADALRQPIDIISFSAMDAGPTSWIRFVIRDSRAIVFATGRRVKGCKGWGRQISDENFPRAAGEMRAIWNYFLKNSGQAAPLPRDSEWFVLPLQLQQDKPLHRIRIQRALPALSLVALLKQRNSR
ncbi:MAG: hypothetical protein HC853_07490 [Anaerolineae bacterium]|nr:hypothetical protein [Anaerolineae bacterium]